MFPIIYSVFALVICVLALVLNIMKKNTPMIAVMSVCILINIATLVLNSYLYFSK